MKTTPNMKATLLLGAIAATLLVAPQAARAQVFLDGVTPGISDAYNLDGTVDSSFTPISGNANYYALTNNGTDLFATDNLGANVGEYTLTGSTVSATLISGLSGSSGIVANGNLLYVSDHNHGDINQYSVSGGVATLNYSNQIGGGAYAPDRLALSPDGSTIYAGLSDFGTGASSIGRFSSAAGNAGSGTFITGYSGTAEGLAVSADGLTLYAAFSLSASTGVINTYDALTGVQTGTNLFALSSSPGGITISGNDLFVAETASVDVQEFSLTDDSLVHTFADPNSGYQTFDVTVNAPAIPEPRATMLIGIGALTLLVLRKRFQKLSA